MTTLTWRVTKAYLHVFYAYMLTYRAEIFLWAIATSLPIIMMGVWAQAAGAGVFEGFTAVDAARYFIAVFIVRQMTVAWVLYEFEYQVISGKLSSLLLHPVDVIWRYIMQHLGEQGARAPFSLFLIVLCFFIQPQALFGSVDQPGYWLPEWWRIVVALIAIGGAFLMRFMMQYIIAMLAFWFERVMAMDSVNMLPYLFLSGLTIPLHVLPERAQEIILWTPYPYLVWFPAQLLTGGDVNVVRGLAMIFGWLVVFTVLNRILWRRGLKHYSAMGA